MSSAPTLSEALFEEYCGARPGVMLRRIQVDITRTPDYELDIHGYVIVSEVKEIERNKEERESDRQLELRGYGNATGGKPGERLRSKIESAGPQLKAKTGGRKPAMLVAFDHSPLGNHVDSYNVRAAMFGLQQIHLAVDPIGHAEPRVTGESLGPGRKMTPTTSTSIGAIAVLHRRPSTNEIGMWIYHNPFAACPLDIPAMSILGARHFEYPHGAGVPRDWVEKK